MLKAQLRSKLIQVDSRWQDAEDVLTSDFFGVLDYLPRTPFLRDFVRSARCNLGGDNVDWDSVEMLFWPRYKIAGETTEPDVILISNRWVVVIEVKLGAGLGLNQPWREYSVGKEIAVERGIRANEVYYVVLARTRPSVEATCKGLPQSKRADLLTRTSYLRWAQVATLVEGWIRNGCNGAPLPPHRVRMLTDLHAAIRRRRTLSFCGFEFPHLCKVDAWEGSLFCPPRFTGFLTTTFLPSRPLSEPFLQVHKGFLAATRTCVAQPTMHFSLFAGFQKTALSAVAPGDPFFAPSRSDGFLRAASACTASPTLLQED